MSNRLCGYCRSSNHRADKCASKANQITAIRRHMYMEKVALHRLALQNGYGVGAIVRLPENITAVIRSVGDMFEVYNNSFIDYRPLKYRKSVRSVLRTYSGVNHSSDLPLDNDFVRWDQMDNFTFICSPLSDLSQNVYGFAAMHKLTHPPVENAKSSVQSYSYYGTRHAEILSPSDETDIDERQLFDKPIRLHERLGRTSDGYGLTVNVISHR